MLLSQTHDDNQLTSLHATFLNWQPTTSVSWPKTFIVITMASIYDHDHHTQQFYASLSSDSSPSSSWFASSKRRPLACIFWLSDTNAIAFEANLRPWSHNCQVLQQQQQITEQVFVYLHWHPNSTRPAAWDHAVCPATRHVTWPNHQFLAAPGVPWSPMLLFSPS